MTARALAKGRTNIGVGVLVGMVGSVKGRLVGTHIIPVVLVAAIHAGQSQNVKAEYECKEFHGANIGKNTFGCAENCRVAVVRLGKIKCAAKVGRLVGGFAALFILRRDSQTALPKIALSVGFRLSVDGCTVGF